ncbi:OB-fold nucleic acid binding domain-containing protein [Flavobacterium sp. AED]|uniref:OB-fold nucleic acid binding domain-containing protein n=1 Tax=Flavobacterium sp. AED TaxID=1423323 RepID=UPI000691E164|nr:OB-fold nucleic acid binding domain-containing protein [Flavobacterium sp. AED]
MKSFPFKKSILSLIILSILSCSSVKTATVRGKVSAIQKGKDGYTATIENTKGRIYFGTISIPNLSNPQLFKQAEIGDTLVVKGEVWKIGKEKQITVREILELKKKNNAEAKITGIVLSVEKGKDGYTAKIKTAQGTIYFAVISIPNLGSAEKYRAFKMGENVTLFGEIWKMGDDNRITVRKILD